MSRQALLTELKISSATIGIALISQVLEHNELYCALDPITGAIDSLIRTDSEHIDRAMVDSAIVALHDLNDIEASIVAEQLDRWYYDSLVEFRIRST